MRSNTIEIIEAMPMLIGLILALVYFSYFRGWLLIYLSVSGKENL